MTWKVWGLYHRQQAVNVDRDQRRILRSVGRVDRHDRAAVLDWPALEDLRRE